jgi:predicted metal-dependent HD superfamily phosphohydrolase
MSAQSHWEAAWRSLRVQAPPGLLAELQARYAEPARAYHTQQHLRECFEHLDGASALAERLAEVQVALWFHDAIYDTRAQDNEARSAQWAREALDGAGVASEVGLRVHALVMATRHAAEPEGADATLLVDVDLSILGAPDARFAEYERQIRREYEWVPEPAYRGARAKVLRSFLDRPAIYGTPWFASRLEERARTNLARSIRELGG